MPNMGRLVEASMVLRAESPHGWQEFVNAMGEYAATITAEMMRCPPELLQRAQGMAIQATEISGILRDAPTLYEKAHNQMRVNRQNGRQEAQGR